MDIKELKIRKKNLKLTTAQLAYMAELPLGTVSKIITGETKNPSYITIEKLDKALQKEEMRARLDAYGRYLSEYIKQHPGEEIDTREVEKKYKAEYKLTDDPIPYAVPIDGGPETFGNLAMVKDNLATVDMLHEYGEDRTIELMDGVIIKNEMPDMKHQIMVTKIGKIIDRFLEDNHGDCAVFDVGVNVRPDVDDEHTLVIPDITVVCDPDKIKEDAIWGPPDWVIEVTSPSTRKRDFDDKLHKYFHCGVREYWIIDMEREKVIVFINGEPMMTYIYSFDDEIPVAIYDDKLKIRIND